MELPKRSVGSVSETFSWIPYINLRFSDQINDQLVYLLFHFPPSNLGHLQIHRRFVVLRHNSVISEVTEIDGTDLKVKA